MYSVNWWLLCWLQFCQLRSRNLFCALFLSTSFMWCKYWRTVDVVSTIAAVTTALHTCILYCTAWNCFLSLPQYCLQLHRTWVTNAWVFIIYGRHLVKKLTHSTQGVRVHWCVEIWFFYMHHHNLDTLVEPRFSWLMLQWRIISFKVVVKFILMRRMFLL